MLMPRRQMISRSDITSRREQIIELATRYGASDLRLFGSVVRGDATPRSDVDLLVRMTGGTSLLDHVGLQQDLEELLQCRVDLVNETCLHPRIRDRVLAEAVAL
jgi:predicted nucleotidyltransferase